jgi:hypothetical protein
MMLPVVTEESRMALMETMNQDEKAWKKEMINHIKEENPEINSLLLELANTCDNDQTKKKVILAGYLVYKALEIAQEEESAEALEFS